MVEATIPEMQQAMEEGRVTARQLVEAHLVRIAMYEERVNAYRELIKDEFATQDQLEQEELSLKKAKTDLETATLDQKLYRKYKKPLDIKQKKAGLVESERGAERALNTRWNCSVVNRARTLSCATMTTPSAPKLPLPPE